MRLVLALSLVGAGSLAAQPRGETELEGVWRLVGVSARNTRVPQDEFRGLTFAFRSDRLVVEGPAKTDGKDWDPRFLSRSTIWVDVSAKPKAINFLVHPDLVDDKAVFGIYQITGDKLLLAVRPLSENRDRPVGYFTDSGTIVTYTLERAAKR